MSLLEIHKSKSRVAEILGWPLNMVNTLTADVITERGLTLEQYAEFVHRHKRLFQGGIFNLDVIDSGEKSYENWLELKRLGVNSMPVHHIGDDIKYLDLYLKQTDYIALGAIAKMTQHRRLLGLDGIWEYLKDSRGKPICRVHGLGMTDLGIMTRYPWFSVDSSRAAILAGLGSIVLPRLKRSGPDYTDMQQLMVSNQGRFHQDGKTNSYYGQGVMQRRHVRDYCASFGFKLEPWLVGRTLRAQTHVRDRKDPAFDGGFEIDDRSGLTGVIDLSQTDESPLPSHLSTNLSNNWYPRMVFNLHVLDAFVDFWKTRGKTIRLYNVIVPGVFDSYVHAVTTSPKPTARCLISYARQSDGGDRFINKLTEVVGHGD
jgi:hypothetical protein